VVPVRVAEGQDRAAPDEPVDPDRLACLVVDQVDLFGSFTSTGLPLRTSSFVSPTLPTICSGGMP
jgi:hypothetical protein